MTVDEALEKEVPSSLSGLVVLAPPSEALPHLLWPTPSEDYLKKVFTLTQRCGDALMLAAKTSGAFYATASRLDGVFGLSHSEFVSDPIQGGLAGLSKTAAHEWPEISIKAIDIDRSWEDTDAVAKAIANELLSVGPVEVGLTDGGIMAIAEETVYLDKDIRNTKGKWILEQGDLVIVSGGGRGVTAECAIAIARQFKPVMVLLGRSPVSDEEPAWLQNLTEDAKIKKAIMEHAAGSITPKALQAEFNRIMSAREIRSTVYQINATGGKAIYKSVNVQDTGEIERMLLELRKQYGGVRGVIHGAGVLRDSFIADKKPEDLDLVFDTKVSGLRALLNVTKNDPLKFIALFSSSTARYGRKGQVDYAMANECLNKIGRQQAQARPDCRVVSICWGPWDGGMVTPALKKLFAFEGVGVIPLREGADQLVKEIMVKPSPDVEVVIGGMLEGESPAAGKPLGSQAVA